ncbi:UMP kinase [Candidatus Peregrinibacteria bacterium]|nr:UMP kinase [Candidatus Peregrinibacteria bacterium]
MSRLKYARVLIKVSGEAFADESGKGVSENALNNFANEIESLHNMGGELAIVLGGGNFWRYRDAKNLKIERVVSDEIGMMATLLNGHLFADVLRSRNIKSVVYSAFGVEGMIPKYSPQGAHNDLSEKKVVLLVGGTGKPYFTTDTAAAERALKLHADLLIKATKVDGVYDDDPEKNKNAHKFETLTFAESMKKNLKVMDQTAFALCSQGNIPVIVLDGFVPGNLKKAILGEKVGTFIANT